MNSENSASDIVSDPQVQQTVIDNNAGTLKTMLDNSRKQLEILEYTDRVIRLITSQPSTYIVEGEGKFFTICPDKLNIPDFSSEKAGFSNTDKAVYRTFPSAHYFKKKNHWSSTAGKENAEGIMLIGRQIAMLNTYPHQLFIDDASVLVFSKPCGNTNKIFSLNPNCPNYVGKFDDQDGQFRKTLSFIKSLDDRTPQNTPQWLQNYLILQ